MTKLRCSAVHCEYNNDQYCCLPDIQIGGGCDAKSSCDTCCDSFRERKTSSGTNCASPYCHPDAQMKVACTAMKCRYNYEGGCKANAIHINGASAVKRGQTACDTFVCNSKNC